jgi:nucleoside-diphosphate-sugar epimerase
MRVLVLGAAGLVGQATIRHLQQNGIECVAGVRRPAARLSAAGVESVQVEATDARSVAAAISKVTHVVNCVMGRPDTMVAATRNVCQAALQAGTSRVVHFSSCAVYGTASGLIDEDAPLGNGVDWYGTAKIECESIVQQSVGNGLAVVMLRPSCVYGPGSELWTARVGRLLAAHRMGDLGTAGDGRCNLIYVDDVAAAVGAALAQPVVSGAVFNLSNPDPPTWNEYFLRYGRMIGAIPVRRLPGWQIRLEQKLFAVPLKLAQLAAARLHVSMDWIPDPITPSLLRSCGLDVTYDASRAATALGCVPTSLERGLALSAAWFVDGKREAVKR